jgi:polysaccharide export outer membrane protein
MKKQIRAASTLSKAIAVILAVGFICRVAAMQDSGPPKELVEYVREARKAGMAEAQIQKNAALAGWQESEVSEALRATSGESPHKAEGKAANGASEPAKNSQSGLPNAGGTEAASAAAGAKGLAGSVPTAGSASSPPAAEAGASITKPAVDRGVPDDYKIGAGDVLHISVWHEPDATVSGVIVRPDGNISMPLLKQVAVLGLTPTQLEKQLMQQLAKFVPAPDVTVIVTGINSKKVYAIGAVKKEGPIPYTYRMTVLQALSEAGGLTEYAKRKKIYVLRTENGRALRLRFNYDAVLKGERMELNVPLMAGDTIVVPQ